MAEHLLDVLEPRSSHHEVTGRRVAQVVEAEAPDACSPAGERLGVRGRSCRRQAPCESGRTRRQGLLARASISSLIRGTIIPHTVAVSAGRISRKAAANTPEMFGQWSASATKT
jgi:hypothetical protein